MPIDADTDTFARDSLPPRELMPDFAFTLESLDARRRPASGTSVRLLLDRPISAAALREEITAVAGLVDPVVARIFVDGEPINTARQVNWAMLSPRPR